MRVPIHKEETACDDDGDEDEEEEHLALSLT